MMKRFSVDVEIILVAILASLMTINDLCRGCIYAQWK